MNIEVTFDLYQAQVCNSDKLVQLLMPVPEEETNAANYLQDLVSSLKWKIVSCKKSGKKLVPVNGDYQLIDEN
ncbi:hypothetical protein MOB49_12220 [Bacillus haynesii]|uniref:hypothetical protein n=1 Tax=Bacillus TaxID=1386 RepID=UPI000779724B|nr:MULTISPECIES: hypothetical protein [Bacillus]KYC71550.1 hypothetical protein B4092_5014 [Bacillus licheniformis]MBW7636301.1 hypothetical protein [Bacillus licheniformis]MCY7967856.1 hypothetical protein [Bacillus haynesii]MCY8102354.1 hypothetical protein [Bacillus haynesii]MCY8152008.1 hypothetical protein [Bacillus paralicheniformis]